MDRELVFETYFSEDNAEVTTEPMRSTIPLKPHHINALLLVIHNLETLQSPLGVVPID
jgi:hypothetical protein